mmetsp:Transcript_98905/g.251067  ORF Transcript_98905/g.251067 Transcript_98905/m.251067 type:complete len:445 (-) Transcript_98905:48-1382(-)|eukprot:CAMPEP_0183518052 /NCGR_PEP_ID=MMETSP0371-20130417/15284_1 /TAXON_ID=268820 /ORGANISM="Peridinium aciculiferum, Strain PAER-2" /LENGTH=444 /DNA_ID=CAMNT_0025716063 /DNA_START=66 /DNA_END=1400 /DNA_ORIENTATION=-
MSLSAHMSGPLTQAPKFARDAHEFRAVLATQSAEIDALKTRLRTSHRECAMLQQRLYDAEGELAVAREATTTATERLGAHAARHSLVLAAGVERSGAERATVEHELTRVEALIHDRDMEIRKLRQQAHELEAAQHQNEVHIKGMEVAHQTKSELAREAMTEVSALLQHLGAGGSGAASGSARGLSQQEVQRIEEISSALDSKRSDHAMLRRRAEATAVETQRFETEEQTLAHRVLAFEQSLRAKQEHMEIQDQRSLQEAASLRGHCEELRRALHSEQRDSVGMDQRVVLHPQAGAEAEGVRRETAALLDTMPRLMGMLRNRGRAVCSPKVPTDAIDVAVHSYLSSCNPAAGDSVPPIIWRLSRGQYLIGDRRVAMYEAGGQLVVRDDVGVATPLSDLIVQRRRTAPVPATHAHGYVPAALHAAHVVGYATAPSMQNGPQHTVNV